MGGGVWRGVGGQVLRLSSTHLLTRHATHSVRECPDHVPPKHRVSLTLTHLSHACPRPPFPSKDARLIRSSGLDRYLRLPNLSLTQTHKRTQIHGGRRPLAAAALFLAHLARYPVQPR